LLRQSSLVLVSHEAVEHSTDDSEVLGEESTVPNERPISVIDAPPVCAVFPRIQLTAGASMEYTAAALVPTSEPTVRPAQRNECTREVDDKHQMTVDVCHELVRQLSPVKCAVDDRSVLPKLRPTLVMLAPPV
jgi:hypothetical protein